MATTPGGPVDFLVITALEEERDAMLAKLDGATPVEKGQAELFTYYIAEVRSARAEQQRYRVVVAQLLEMGPVQAAVQTAAAVISCGRTSTQATASGRPLATGLMA